MVRLLNIFILVFALGYTSSHEKLRAPASVAGQDPCHEAMRDLFSRRSGDNISGEFVDDVIDLNRLIESDRLSPDEFNQIYDSPAWRDYFVTKEFNATDEEKVMIAGLLQKADPDAPVEALQRKYSLLIEFCGL
tara:strand:+ start:653 stop:1054 length:402 start_codon:yes stop_codon:yes gene_type:complete